MNRERIEEIRDRWDGSVTGLYPTGTEEADYRDVHDLLAEIDRLHSWRGLMELLDEYWPEGASPTVPDNDSRDDGPRIVALIRWVDQLTRQRETLNDTPAAP